MFSEFSDVKVFWVCRKSEEHKWEARIASRSQGHGCPYCAGKRVTKERSLVLNRPDLVNEFDKRLNSGIDVDTLSLGSGKEILWTCSKCKHQWSATVGTRTRGHGCPKCGAKNRRYTIPKEKQLSETHPGLAGEWNHNRNDRNPDEYSYGSRQKVWWRCPNCSHQYQQVISKRTSRGTGCPKCRGR